MKIKKLLSYLFLVFILEKADAQDAHFSQYNFSPLTLNPALTSAYKDLQGTVNFKDQWRSMNAFRTAGAVFEMKLNQKRWTKLSRVTEGYKKKLVKGLAFGLNFFSDKAGDGAIKTTTVNLSIAYHALLNKNNTLSAGLIGGIMQRSISPDPLRWNNQYTGGIYNSATMSGENFANQNFMVPDFGMGIMWSYGSEGRYTSLNDQVFANAGASIQHLNTPSYSFLGTAEKIYRKYTFHSNTMFGIKNTHYSIAPSLLVTMQGKQKEITVGSLIKYKVREESKYTGIIKSSVISFGCFYRNKDAIIPTILLEMDRYTIGISYDTNISGLAAASSGRGGFEISLRIGTGSSFLYQNAKWKM
jgi:type IX secretion system PorP/SprF family membrane protein